MMLSVASVSAQNGWYEDFEHYAAGAFLRRIGPSAETRLLRIDNNFRASGNQSVRLYGAVGGCWGALLHRPVNVSSSFTIEFQTRNGSEPLSGCHPLRSIIALYTGASWTTGGRKIISFDGDGQIRGSSSPSNSPSGSVLGTYATGEWIKTKITYERLDASTVRLSYWINDQLKKTEVLAALSYESQLAYLSPAVAEGTAWFDDIKVTPGWVHPQFPSRQIRFQRCKSGCRLRLNLTRFLDSLHTIGRWQVERCHQVWHYDWTGPLLELRHRQGSSHSPSVCRTV